MLAVDVTTPKLDVVAPVITMLTGCLKSESLPITVAVHVGIPLKAVENCI